MDGIGQVGHGAGPGVDPAGVGHQGLDVHAGTDPVGGLHGAPIDPVLTPGGRHGLGGGEGLAGPYDCCGVVEVHDGEPGAAGVIGDPSGLPPSTGPGRGG